MPMTSGQQMVGTNTVTSQQQQQQQQTQQGLMMSQTNAMSMAGGQITQNLASQGI